MSKIISSSYISKIINTNKKNVIETNNENIIESDSEFREVIKKGYLLSNINLSTVPDIIADAIRDAMEDTKNATLSDALIQTLKQSIENFDDGIYKKTYIDNTITYLENLLIQKAGPETVAAIVDSKIAIATSDLVATAQVEMLTSRIGNSESEISNVRETMNTKDLARASQIDTLSASIEDTFAGYSNAIGLYVDSEGNVQAEKIETLSTNIGLQIQEVNQLIIDQDEEWSAKSLKLITNPSGGITGYSFEDGSGLVSNFTINADNFKISNSTNTYTPFSISGGSVLLNGRVAFSNTIGGTEAVQTAVNGAIINIPWQTQVQTALNNNATYIDGNKITTGTISANKINTNGLVADSAKLHTLTSTNTTIQNALIKSANIADAAITNAKIGNGQITSAKIGDAQITTAKIGDAQIDTLRVAGEAITITRYAEGLGSGAEYSISIQYTPTFAHGVIISMYTDSGINHGLMKLEINGIIFYNQYINSYTYSIGFSTMKYHYLSAGVQYTFKLSSFYSDPSADGGGVYGPNYKRLVVQGAKR